MGAALPKRRPTLLKGSQKVWYAPKALDQGQTPRCVGYGMTQFLRAAPVTHPKKTDVLRVDPDLFAAQTYGQAQRLDEWDGEAYDGTSVRAGCKALQDQGYISGYLWDDDAATVASHVLLRGPVVIGTTWFEGMDDPDPKTGRVHVSGQPVGGHCYVLIGYNPTLRAFRLLNSWGSSWGQHGRAWLALDDAEYLIGQADGEAVSMMEVTTDPVTRATRQRERSQAAQQENARGAP